MKRICTICARGGSKGVKGKNIKNLVGVPLIAHSIRQALETGLFDEVVVSSDSKEILDVSQDYGATLQIERPLNLATDYAAKLPVIRHCVLQTELKRGVSFDTCVDLDATSPLRNLGDIQKVVEILEKKNSGNVITGMVSRRSPYFNMVEIGKDGCVQLSKKVEPKYVRRQDAPECYDMNASIYAWTKKSLIQNEGLFNPETELYVMPESRSIDIDSETDFLFVEFLMNNRKNMEADQ